MQLQVSGTGNHDTTHFAEFAARQARIGHFADPYGTVNALVEQIDQPIGQIKPYRDIGIGEHEGSHLRRHMPAPESQPVPTP
jgi:hypothetical protein